MTVSIIWEINDEKLVQIISDNFYVSSESISSLAIYTILDKQSKMETNLWTDRLRKLSQQGENKLQSFSFSWETPICNKNYYLFLKTTQQVEFDFFSMLLSTLSKP